MDVGQVTDMRALLVQKAMGYADQVQVSGCGIEWRFASTRFVEVNGVCAGRQCGGMILPNEPNEHQFGLFRLARQNRRATDDPVQRRFMFQSDVPIATQLVCPRLRRSERIEADALCISNATSMFQLNLTDEKSRLILLLPKS
jgi:hypothetical protein